MKKKNITRVLTSCMLAFTMAVSAIGCDTLPDTDTHPEHSESRTETLEIVTEETAPTTETDPAKETSPNPDTGSGEDDPAAVPEPDNGDEPEQPTETEPPLVTEPPTETEPPHVHSYADSVTKEPTCVDAGVKSYTCDCGDRYTDIISPTGHSYGSEITKEATCTGNGETTYTCTGCGDSYTEVIAATGHSYKKSDEKTTASTVNGSKVETTVTTYTCENCKDSYKDTKTETVDSGHTHSYTSKVTKEAGCETAGVETYTCSCGSSYTKTIPATGHTKFSPGKVTKAATCTENGVKTYTCSVCNHYSYTEVIPAMGHLMFYNLKNATCLEDGLKTYYCDHSWEDPDTHRTINCDESYTETVPAKGHSYKLGSSVGTSYGGTVDYPQLSKTTYTYRCSCGDSYTVFEIRLEELEEADGQLRIKDTHYCTSEIVRELSCTVRRRETFTCIDCGKSWTRDTDFATGHDYTEKVVAPTQTEQGYTLHTCNNCGYSYKDEYTPALHKHSYTSTVTKAATCSSEGVRTYKCSCGASYTETIAKTSHTYSTKVTKAATCETAGVRTYICSGCGASYTESISATGHDWTTETVHHDEVTGTRDVTETYVHQVVYEIHHVTNIGAAINFNRDTFKKEALELGLTDLYNAIVNNRIGTCEQMAAVDPLFAKYYGKYIGTEPNGCTNTGCSGYHFYVANKDVIYNKSKPLYMVIQTKPGETQTKTLNIDDDVQWLYSYSSFEYYEFTYADGTEEKGYSSTNSFAHDMFLISKSKTPPRTNNTPYYITGNWGGPYAYKEEFEKTVGKETYVITPAYDETVKVCTRCGRVDSGKG